MWTKMSAGRQCFNRGIHSVKGHLVFLNPKCIPKWFILKWWNPVTARRIVILVHLEQRGSSVTLLQSDTVCRGRRGGRFNRHQMLFFLNQYDCLNLIKSCLCLNLTKALWSCYQIIKRCILPTRNGSLFLGHRKLMSSCQIKSENSWRNSKLKLKILFVTLTTYWQCLKYNRTFLSFL